MTAAPHKRPQQNLLQAQGQQSLGFFLCWSGKHDSVDDLTM